jgi:ABC-type dipeptide/oligopeptide/nickel transport system permease subunit
MIPFLISSVPFLKSIRQTTRSLSHYYSGLLEGIPWLMQGWLVLLLIAVISTLFIPYDTETIRPLHAMLAPLQVLAFPLGTDDLGRDVLARLITGAQLSIGISLATAFVSCIIGGWIGIWAGWKGGSTDNLLMSVVDFIYSLPGLMIVILLALFLEPSLTGFFTELHIAYPSTWARLLSMVAALSLFSWPQTSRLIRGHVQQLKQEAYIDASRIVGASFLRLLSKHLLPNLSSSFALATMVTIPRALLTESTLSFMGLGIEAPLASWGTIASEGWMLVRVSPSLLLLTSICIVMSLLAFYYISERLKRQV